MDVPRTSAHVRTRRIRRTLYLLAAITAALLITLGLARLKPAAPEVNRTAVWIGEVKRGPLVRQVRGIGTLVPEDIRWIPATTQGRVERIILRPGTTVTRQSVILELSNPQLEQELQEAALKVKAAEASLANLRVQLQNDYLQQKAAAANIAAEYNKADMLMQMNEALAEKQLVSALVLKQSQVDAEQLGVRNKIAAEQLASYEQGIAARIAVQQSEVDQAQALLQLRQQQRDELKVRAGLDGVLQLVVVEAGQQVAPGTNLVRVADPRRLKAEVKIAETQAKDLQLGQHAEIDTRNGIMQGVVARIDPSVQNGTRTVDVTLVGELPKGAVPDLSVDGTIELERVADVLYVDRPAVSEEQSEIGMFKLDPAGSEASRVRVKLGRASLNAVEVTSGLRAGDRVLLSDMSAWDGVDRVRIR
jgi:HlyD family secretion protein